VFALPLAYTNRMCKDSTAVIARQDIRRRRACLQQSQRERGNFYFIEGVLVRRTRNGKLSG